MKRKTRKILSFILTAALLVGCFFYGKSLIEKHMGQQDYDEALAIATGGVPISVPSPAPQTGTVPAAPGAESSTGTDGTQQPVGEEVSSVSSDPYVEALKAIDLEALQAVNPEVIGWLFIPDTDINYPILRHENNDYYLDHTWKDSENRVGAIFMDSTNAPDLSDFNTLIYGHNMGGSMFATLEDYSNRAFYEAHPSIYVVVEGGIYKYDIFAIHRAGMKTIAFGMQMSTDKKRKEFINFALDYSEFNTGIVPTTDDSFLTLSTCSYNRNTMRLVVQAVLDREASLVFTS